jgi:hypothetical protein
MMKRTSRRPRKRVLQKVTGTTLIVAGILIFLVFCIFWKGLLGIAVGGAVVLFGGIVLLRRERRSALDAQAEWKRFKENARQITVLFDDCEIVDNHYFVEVPRSNNSRIQAWDSLYDSSRSVEQIEVNQSRLLYRDKTTGETYASPLIDKDPATLRFKLFAQKQTVIYLDDSGQYYFDLDFLYN